MAQLWFALVNRCLLRAAPPPRPAPPRPAAAAAVILTEVRIQGYGRCAAWLWVLTFVRMTVGGRGVGFAQ